MSTNWLARIPYVLSRLIYIMLDLIGLLLTSVSQSRLLLIQNKRIIFWRLFNDQLFKAGTKSVLVVSVIAILLSWLVTARAYSLLPSNIQFYDYYAQFFVIAVVREIGPLICGLILIARSASTITYEIGHLQLNRQFEALNAMAMPPIFFFLLPALLALPLRLLMMVFTFIFVCFVSSFAFININFNAPILFFDFINLIASQLNVLEIIALLIKVIIGGLLIALISVYFGAQVEDKFTDVSEAISRATSLQLLVFVSLNVGMSVINYL